MFLKSFEHILTHDLVPTYGFKESHYYYALGKDLGTDLHRRILKELIEKILDDKRIPNDNNNDNRILNFGWFKYTPNNNDELAFLKGYCSGNKGFASFWDIQRYGQVRCTGIFQYYYGYGPG